MRQRNSILQHAVGVSRYPHLPLHLTGDRHLLNAVDSVELGQYAALHVFRHSLRAAVGNDTELDDRYLVRVKPGHFGIIHPFAEGHDVDMVLYGTLGLPHVGAVFECRQDQGVPLDTGRLDGFQSLRSLYCLFDRGGYVRNHRLGVSGGIRGGDHHQGELDLGKKLDLQRVIGKYATSQ